MSTSNENFSTPVQKKGSRNLGLRRNNSTINKVLATTSEVPGSSAQARNGMSTTLRMRPQSDVKVNYRNEGESNKDICTQTPRTPNTSCLLQRQSASSNCRPYRLSLSKRVREKMTKKRLEFHIANEMEKEEEERKLDQQQEHEYNVTASRVSAKYACCRLSALNEAREISKSASADKDPQEMSRDELIAAIEKSRKELKARQNHACKSEELQQAINTWKVGFATALSDLQGKILPTVDKETLLAQLRIPKEMIKYVND